LWRGEGEEDMHKEGREKQRIDAEEDTEVEGRSAIGSRG
jgi:hypothetical protein